MTRGTLPPDLPDFADTEAPEPRDLRLPVAIVAAVILAGAVLIGGGIIEF